MRREGSIARWNGAGYWSGETLQWPSGTIAKEHWMAGWNIGLPTCCHIHDSHPDIELSIRPTGWNVTALDPALRLSLLNSAHLDIAAMLNTLLFCSSVFVCSVAQCYIVFLLCCIVCVCCLVCACLMGVERDLWMVSQLTDKVGKSKKQLTREYQS